MTFMKPALNVECGTALTELSNYQNYQILSLIEYFFKLE